MKQSEPNSQGPVVHHQTPQAGNSIPRLDTYLNILLASQSLLEKQAQARIMSHNLMSLFRLKSCD